MRRKAGPPLSPEIVFTEELEKCIGKNNLGIYLNIGKEMSICICYMLKKILVNKIFICIIGQAYVEEPFIQPCFYDGKKVIFDTDPSRTITTRSQSTFKLPEDKLYNRLLIGGLGSFNLTEEYKNLFQNLLYSWIDPFNYTKSFNHQQILRQMTFPTYGKKR